MAVFPTSQPNPDLERFPDLQGKAAMNYAPLPTDPTERGQFFYGQQQRAAEQQQAAAAQQAALEQAAWEQRMMKNMVLQMEDQAQASAAVDDQMKAIQQASRFIATRKLARDLESGVPVHQALARNATAWLGTTGASGAFKAMTPAAPEVPLGSITEAVAPGGSRLGHLIRTGTGSVQLVPPTDNRQMPTTGNRITALNARARMVQDEIEGMVLDTTIPKEEKAQRLATLREERQSIADALRTVITPTSGNAEEAALPPGAGSALPTAAPAPAAPATGRNFNWDAKAKRLIPGP